MSIDSGVPDLENKAKDSDKADEELEIEDNSKTRSQKNRGKQILETLNTNIIQMNLMK